MMVPVRSFSDFANARRTVNADKSVEEWASELVAGWPVPGPRVADRLVALLLPETSNHPSVVDTDVA